MEDNRPQPSLAIVILNYNGIQYLKKFLPFLIEIDGGQFSLHIIDNSSTDNSLQFLDENYPSINCIRLDENHGFSGGYNKGLQEINSDYYFLLNSDIKTSREDVVKLFDYITEHPECGALQPKVRAVDDPRKFEYAGASGGYMDSLGYPFCRGRIFEEIEEDRGQYDTEEDIFWASGAAMMVKSEVFHELEGFEESFFAHHEEIDLCWRMQRAGYEIKVLPSAVVYHKGGGTLSYHNPFKTYLNFRNNWLAIIRNFPVSKLLWLVPLRFILDGVAALFYIINGEFKLILPIVKAHYKILVNFRKHWRNRAFANERIAQFKRAKESPQLSGMTHKSIIFQHFILGKSTFEEIMK